MSLSEHAEQVHVVDENPTRTRLWRRLDPLGLPLFWKLLLPFLALLVLLGAAGTFVVVRELAGRTQTRLDQDLLRRSVEARAAVTDRELYLIESTNFAANIQGMDTAVRRQDRAAAGRLLESVAALKGDLALLAVTNRGGAVLVGFQRDAADGPLAPSGDVDLATLAADVIGDASGAKSAAFLRVGGKSLLVIGGPICSGGADCAASGVAVVGMDVALIATGATGTPAASDGGKDGVTIFGTDGEVLASVGSNPTSQPPDGVSTELVRRTESVDGEKLATAYSALSIQGQPRGVIAVTRPTAEAFDAVRGAAYRLALLVLLAMIGVVVLGALLSKYILGQVSPLLATSRALGGGDLTARAPVLADDELGELARGLNLMADELQASHANLESRVEQRTAEVQRLMSERSNFFAMLSHELRTPLAVILNQADLLEGSDDADAAHDAADAIRMSSTQLLTLVNDILEVAKAEAGRLEMEVKNVSVTTAIADLRRTLTGLATARGIELSVSLPSRLPSVSADPRRLREVVLNLVDNAVKYTPTGGSVEVTAEAVDDGVELHVRDTGVGIPAEVGDAIFEPFYRVEGTRTQHGEPSSGLGLALSQRLMTAMGGGLRYESSADGTVFTVTLGRAQSKPTKRPRHGMASPARRAAKKAVARTP